MMSNSDVDSASFRPSQDHHLHWNYILCYRLTGGAGASVNLDGAVERLYHRGFDGLQMMPSPTNKHGKDVIKDLVTWTCPSALTRTNHQFTHCIRNHLHTGSVNACWLQVNQDQVVVSATADNVVAQALQLGAGGLAVGHHLCLVRAELWGVGHLQGHSKGADGVVVWATLQSLYIRKAVQRTQACQDGLRAVLRQNALECRPSVNIGCTVS